jgi:hypothetical protein
LRKCDFITGKVRYWPDPDPRLFIPDPDPAKSSGSDRIRIRIRFHNTALKGKMISGKNILMSLMYRHLSWGSSLFPTGVLKGQNRPPVSVFSSQRI